jgi:hypothetical protein
MDEYGMKTLNTMMRKCILVMENTPEVRSPPNPDPQAPMNSSLASETKLRLN